MKFITVTPSNNGGTFARRINVAHIVEYEPRDGGGAYISVSNSESWLRIEESAEEVDRMLAE